MNKIGIFLDVKFELIPSPDDINFYHIKHSIYQKSINIYQYIPYMSAHRSHTLYNFILNEFKRYSLLCSHENDFQHTASLFTQRNVDILPTWSLKLYMHYPHAITFFHTWKRRSLCLKMLTPHAALLQLLTYPNYILSPIGHQYSLLIPYHILKNITKRMLIVMSWLHLEASQTLQTLLPAVPFNSNGFLNRYLFSGASPFLNFSFFLCCSLFPDELCNLTKLVGSQQRKT
jgi:hypothetical protein